MEKNNIVALALNIIGVDPLDVPVDLQVVLDFIYDDIVASVLSRRNWSFLRDQGWDILVEQEKCDGNVISVVVDRLLPLLHSGGLFVPQEVLDLIVMKLAVNLVIPYNGDRSKFYELSEQEQRLFETAKLGDVDYKGGRSE